MWKQNPMIQVFKKTILSLILIGTLATTGHSRYSYEEGTPGLRAFGNSVVGKYQSTPGFFLEPKASYGTWNREYQMQPGKHGQNITALQIFETMGISARGILNGNRTAPESVAHTEMHGNFEIASGNAFGIRRENATPAEERIIVRELLNMGHFAAQTRALEGQIKALEDKYRTAGQAYERQHLQMCALFLRAGAGVASLPTAWYLKDLNRSAVDSKIRQYTDNMSLMPTAELVAVASSGFGPNPTVLGALPKPKAVIPPPPVPVKPVADVRFDPNEIVLRHFDGKSFLYGAGDIHPSKVHADAAGARFLNVPGLGTLKNPPHRSAAVDAFSIVAALPFDHFLVITSTPELMGKDDAFVLLPGYMEADASSAKNGRVTVSSFKSDFFNPPTPSATWNVEDYKQNSGILTLRDPKFKSFFSFKTTLIGHDSKPKTFYYLRVPSSVRTPLRTFLRLPKEADLTLDSILQELAKGIRESTRPLEGASLVLAELSNIQRGIFPQ